MRRELIDLARHYGGPEGPGAHHSTQARRNGAGNVGSNPPAYEPSDVTHDPERLAAWTEFHRQVEALDDEDREVFDLLWYQGLTQAEAATLLGVSERTISRRWLAARLSLHRALGGHLPEP
jgi:RNA polymerase sigma-70 factor (ECF subfamily)